jgi:hypothetical protein
MKQVAGSSACYLPHAGFFFVLFFDTDDGGDMFCVNSTDFQLTTRPCILEDRTHCNHCCENQ